MERSAAVLAACVVACVGALAQDAPPPVALPARGVIGANRLNVRRGPGVNPPIGQLTRGAEVMARKRHDTWLEIDYPHALGPWVSRACVAGDGLDAATVDAPVSARIGRDRTQIRCLPSARGLMLDELREGTPITVVGLANAWCRILPPEGLTAFIHADYVEFVAAAAPTDRLGPAVGAPATAPSTAPRANADLPAAVADKIGFAGQLLGAGGSLPRVESALSLLQEALSDESLTDVQRAVARRRAAEAIATLSPARLLDLFELARRDQSAGAGEIERRYGPKLRDARDSLVDAPQIEFTARGVLRANDEAAGTFRLFSGGTLVCELVTGGADLSPFVGKEVGVVGTRRDAARAGGPPHVVVQYVEEIAPGAAEAP